MNNITIGAMSDMHGFLPNVIEKSDLMCICGDIFPLNIDRNIEESEKWFYQVFLPWVKNLPCEYVIMIPGNHCLYLESIYLKFGRITIPDYYKEKVLCLVDESCVYKGIKFYGTPWVTNLSRWAFNTDAPQSKYEKIPKDCDILITHHAPDYGKLGCSYPDAENEKNYGSAELAQVILKRPNIKYHFCGHIHTGVHGGIRIGNTLSFNVSLLNEQYQEEFPPTYIEY